MTTTKRLGLSVGASLLALGVSAGVHASAQNTNPGAPPFSGRGRMGPGGPGGPLGPGGPMGMLRMLGPELGLTDAQKDQVKNIAQAHRDEQKALGDRARTAHEALHAAIMAETVDEALIRQRSADVAAVDADLAVAQARVHAEVWQILTPEQRSKAASIQAQAKERMQQQRPGGGRRGRGAL